MHKSNPAYDLQVIVALCVVFFQKSQAEYLSVADPDQPFGGSQIGGRQKCLHLHTKGCLRQSLCVTQKTLSFVGQKVAIFVG